MWASRFLVSFFRMPKTDALRDAYRHSGFVTALTVRVEPSAPVDCVLCHWPHHPIAETINTPIRVAAFTLL